MWKSSRRTACLCRTPNRTARHPAKEFPRQAKHVVLRNVYRSTLDFARPQWKNKWILAGVMKFDEYGLPYRRLQVKCPFAD
jgi:hypothetical protein